MASASFSHFSFGGVKVWPRCQSGPSSVEDVDSVGSVGESS